MEHLEAAYDNVKSDAVLESKNGGHAQTGRTDRIERCLVDLPVKNVLEHVVFLKFKI